MGLVSRRVVGLPCRLRQKLLPPCRLLAPQMPTLSCSVLRFWRFTPDASLAHLYRRGLGSIPRLLNLSLSSYRPTVPPRPSCTVSRLGVTYTAKTRLRPALTDLTSLGGYTCARNIVREVINQDGVTDALFSAPQGFAPGPLLPVTPYSKAIAPSASSLLVLTRDCSAGLQNSGTSQFLRFRSSR